MMEDRVEAGEVSVEVRSGIQEDLEVKMVNEVEVGSECDAIEDVEGNGDVVANGVGDNECDNSYVLVIGNDVMVEDERGNVSEVSVEVSDREVLGESRVKEDEVEGLDGGQEDESREDDKTPVVVENGVSLVSDDVEESHEVESDMVEMKTDVDQETKMVDEEAEQGEVVDTLQVEETVKAEYSNKVEDAQTVNITLTGHESEHIICSGAVEIGSVNIGIPNPNVEEKQNSEIEIVESNEPEHAAELEKESNDDYSLYKIENQDSEVSEELKREFNKESPDENGNQESEDDALVNLMELEQPGRISMIDESLSGKVVALQEAHVSEEEHKLVIKSEVSSGVQDNGKCESYASIEELVLNTEEQNNSANILSVESNADIPNKHDDFLSSKISSANINYSGENIIDSDVTLGQIEEFGVVNPTSTEQEEKGLEFRTLVDENDSETAEAEQNMPNKVLLDLSSQENKELATEITDMLHSSLVTERANGNSINGNVHDLVDVGEVVKRYTDTGDINAPNDNEWPEQTMSNEVLLDSPSKENKELASEITDMLHSSLVTECVNGHSINGNGHDLVDVGEVVELDTDTGDRNAPNDNEWPELSYYTAQRKLSTVSIVEVLGTQGSVKRESEEIHLADQDRKEVQNGSPEDEDPTSHKKKVVDASLSEGSANACADSGASKEINNAGESATWADYNDQIDGISSSSVPSTCSHSRSVSDGVVTAANLENEVATSESGSKDGESNLNEKLEASKVEISSEEDSSLAFVESEVDRRPFFFLIKVPRFEDDEVKEQIKFAQHYVDETTRLRDSHKVPIQTKKDICLDFNNKLEEAKLKEKAARDQLKAKRKEIDAVQAVIDKVNNAMTVEDIKGSILIMEHKMQHETVSLSEEKQLMREIKRLRHFKEQLSSSIGTQEEIQEALDQKDQIKDHLKSLKRELNSIRSDVQRAEIVTKDAKKKCFDEYAELNQLQLDFKAADGVRQEAYMSLVSLRRELAQKNKFFRMYKDTEKLANDYALSGDKKSLHSLCVNQVDRVMELWNTNDQFRNDYIKCNARSTLRRLKTFDGRSLGLNEEPPSLPNIRNDRINHSEVLSNSLSHSPPPEDLKIHVPSVAEKVVNEPVMDVSENNLAKKQSKSTAAVSEVPTALSLETAPVTEEEVKKTKEEEELAKKEEEIRKREEEAKMLEQLQMEERAKALEALERKKRMAERAQARAKLRAKKEAEQREKEREKRLRKKEKRKDGKENGTDVTAVSEPKPEVTKEANPIEKSVTKKPYKPSHYVKGIKTTTMPINLRNRHRRKLQMWMWTGIAVLAVIAMVLVWFGYLSYLAERGRIGH